MVQDSLGVALGIGDVQEGRQFHERRREYYFLLIDLFITININISGNIIISAISVVILLSPLYLRI
jgi:hypothetical protein